MGTVNPYLRRKSQEFKLIPIKRDGETDLPPLTFSQDQSELNRANLEANNTTITRKLQATIEYQDGKWMIYNGCEHLTTFICVQEAHELKDGDIILMGDRRFEFKV